MSSTTKTPKYQNKIERLNATKLAESIINKNSYLTAAANNSSTNSTSPHKKTSNRKGSWTKYISENSETQAKENFKLFLVTSILNIIVFILIYIKHNIYILNCTPISPTEIHKI